MARKSSTPEGFPSFEAYKMGKIMRKLSQFNFQKSVKSSKQGK